MAEARDLKKIKSLSIDANFGSYALDVSPLIFENCRERFMSKFSKNGPNFFFKHSSKRGNQIIEFINKTERVLELDDNTNFLKTNYDSIIWVQPSQFWRDCPMRRSLFTILLRVGDSYKKEEDNYEEVLFSHSYLKNTEEALFRFFFGFNKYVGPSISSTSSVWVRGWKSVFENQDKEKIKEMLISQNSNWNIN